MRFFILWKEFGENYLAVPSVGKICSRPWKDLFQALEQSVPSLGIKCSKAWNAPFQGLEGLLGLFRPKSEEYVGEYLVGGAGLTIDVGGCLLAGLLQEGGIGGEAVHEALEVLVAGDLEAATLSLQALGLLELLVLRAEDDGHAPDGCLEGVVDAHAEAAAHVGHGGIAIDAGEQAEAVDD